MAVPTLDVTSRVVLWLQMGLDINKKNDGERIKAAEMEFLLSVAEFTLR